MDEYNARITAEISQNAVTFTNEVMGQALESWGYDRIDVEAAMLELARYRAIGTVVELTGLRSMLAMAKEGVRNMVNSCQACICAERGECPMDEGISACAWELWLDQMEGI